MLTVKRAESFDGQPQHKQKLIANFTHKCIRGQQTATLAISPLSNPKDPEETNLPAIYSHNNLNGKQRTSRMENLVMAVSLLSYCHQLGGPTGLSSLPLFFSFFVCMFFLQISPYNNLVLLAAISVLHSEMQTSFPQLLNFCQDFPQAAEISTSKELDNQSKRCTVYPTHTASLIDVTQHFFSHGK